MKNFNENLQIFLEKNHIFVSDIKHIKTSKLFPLNKNYILNIQYFSP